MPSARSATIPIPFFLSLSKSRAAVGSGSSAVMCADRPRRGVWRLLSWWRRAMAVQGRSVQCTAPDGKNYKPYRAVRYEIFTSRTPCPPRSGYEEKRIAPERLNWAVGRACPRNGETRYDGYSKAAQARVMATAMKFHPTAGGSAACGGCSGQAFVYMTRLRTGFSRIASVGLFFSTYIRPMEASCS